MAAKVAAKAAPKAVGKPNGKEATAGGTFSLSKGGGMHQYWPKRQELQLLMEEHSLEMLKRLGEGIGINGLCKRLGTDPKRGLPQPVRDVDLRMDIFGKNQMEDHKLTPYWRYVVEGLKDKIIMLLIFMGTLEIVLNASLGTPRELAEASGEACMMYLTVCIIVNTAAFLDWKRERMFEALQERLAASNTRFVVRGGKQLMLTDNDIVVGDVLAFNSHMAAFVPCDCLLISGQGVKCDESALTGEPEPISKNVEKPFMISGTTVASGSGTMLVIAVGEYSVAGKIRKQVYSDDAEEEESPLYSKLDTMANQIGKVGCIAAAISMSAMIVNTFALDKSTNYKQLVNITLQTLGILACAIPEGLPLALVIALALTSNKMTSENNLVKTLNSCETMGSTTTICTDKTGTLTTNRMTVRAVEIGGVLITPKGSSVAGPLVKAHKDVSVETQKLLAQLICVCTMDESGFTMEPGKKEPTFQGNPTECAMLKMASELGYDYDQVREYTSGRSKNSLDMGSCKQFSSARKMMSWTVPYAKGGGYRVYAKGASEIILSRCTNRYVAEKEVPLSQADMDKLQQKVIGPFADMAYRTIGLAYKDCVELEGDQLHDSILNTDGSPAFSCETSLTLLGVVGIEDPLRPEVAPAIEKCFRAGIDVRMVTGDNLQTAVAIAKGAGILNVQLHCDKSGALLPKRAMEGKDFRKYVHDYNAEGEGTFNQARFDEIWPYLRVLARSSPDDKLTLANGLRGSNLFLDKDRCQLLKYNENIIIFPDHQVVAMTGDGTNDAPALRSSDVGFAMGIAGTQIAKDAANVILLDDNFASIVVAAKWGRNVYDSIQKFLQFQLTVNVAVLTLNIICSIINVKCPLGVLHLLWVNMIMDAAASLALASESPTEALLERPPVNRNESIVTKRMLFNILGGAAYELAVVLFILFKYDWIPDLVIEEGDPLTDSRSRHYTILFNVFVLLQVFNEYNSRFLDGEWRIWRGLLANKFFLTISFGTLFLQIIMVQVAAPILTFPLRIHPKGITGVQWIICLAFAAGTIPWKYFLNVVYYCVAAVVARRRRKAEQLPLAVQNQKGKIGTAGKQNMNKPTSARPTASNRK